MPDAFAALDAYVSANHAPNENIAIADYIDHIRAFGRFLHAFAGRSV